MDDEVPTKVQMAHAYGADWYVPELARVDSLADVEVVAAHEAAVHAARLRVELSQSKREQQEYLKNVELARVLDKRADRKRKAGQDVPTFTESPKKQKHVLEGEKPKTARREKPARSADSEKQLSSVLGSIF